ncbi:carbohydrate ABC transporter permease [Paenibacillus psychroresistens]|uniref:Carbohydrate ABC transporter permease n=1 Tax=Paenibacillus psychroresistens TaxID=1778678 RepID=A0A6B8RR84_9BACL|nr:carbohydrate ABC transporter permease [Paenibacillus psychroresistens]QGQ98324.1 carbohydrate ABC transporter permease [Paenibacillus psychroresistens]
MKTFKTGSLPLLLINIALCTIALIVLIPLFMILINSLKDTREAAMFSMKLPSVWKFSNYATVFEKGKLLNGYKNSINISLAVVLFINLFGSMAAFIIQRNTKQIAKWIYFAFIIGMIIPASIIPTIKVMQQLHINNTLIGIIFYYTATGLPFAVFLLAGFMKTIPKELDEAAIVDGSSSFTIYSRIVLPLLRTVLVTVSIITVMGVWNDFTGPFYLLTKSKDWTVVISVFNFKSTYVTDWGLVFADMTLVITPIIILYFLLQKHIVEGLTAGAFKG